MIRKKIGLLAFLLWGCADQTYKDYLASKKLPIIENQNYCLGEDQFPNKKIKIIKQLESSAPPNFQCEFLKQIEADFCETSEWIHPGSLIQLKNQVIALGGDSLILKLPLTPNKYQRISGEVFKCRGSF